MPKALAQYFGGKQEQLDILLPLVQSIKHHTWVEAACGMASLTLAKEPAAVEVINDFEDRVVCLFEAVRDHPKWLSAKLSATPYSRRVFEECKALAADADEERRVRGWAYLTCLRQSFSSAPGEVWGRVVGHSRRKMASSCSRWLPIHDNVAAVADRLRTVLIERQDAADLIAAFDRPETLFYVDLPYLPLTRKASARNVFHQEADLDTHKRMLKAAIRAKGKFIISGYAHPLYDKVLTEERGWERHQKEVTCRSAVTAKGTVASDKTRTEVVWVRR